METSVELYAELLLNIRSLSLSGRINSKPTDAKEVEVIGEGNIIKVRFNGAEAAIEVPIKTIVSELCKIKIAGTGKDEIASRLPLVDGLIEPPKQQNGSDNVAPWPAEALGSNLALHCRRCARVMVKPGNIGTWKDLPSTNWAEMMDFWHCHKPHEHDHSAGTTEPSQDGEQHRLTSSPGTGFVDIASFVFHRDNVTTSVKIKSADLAHKDETLPSLLCMGCLNIVGQAEDSFNGWRIFKWATAIKFPQHTQFASYETEKWVAAQILSITESQGVRKFLVEWGGDVILMWLFTPDLFFCSSSSLRPSRRPPNQPPKAERACKMLYKRLTDPDECEVNRKSTMVEELDFVAPLRETLAKALDENHTLLPDASQEFKEWEVSLLRRFEAEDLEAIPSHTTYTSENDLTGSTKQSHPTSMPLRIPR